MKVWKLLVGLLTISPVIAQEVGDTPLLAEVKQAIVIPDIDEKAMDNNAYVSLFVINAPERADRLTIVKKMIIQDNQILQQAVQNNDKGLLEQFDRLQNYFGEDYERTYETENYKFACDSLKNYQCVQAVIKDKQQIIQHLEQNKILLTRYKELLKLPNYHAYSMVADMEMAGYHHLLTLSKLRLAQAIIDINEGRVKEGLAILQEEIEFSRDKLLANGYLIDSAIAIRNLSVIYNVIAGLLDHPNLAPYLQDSQLVALIQPLTTKQQQSLVEVFKKERQFQLLAWQFISIVDIKKSMAFNEEWGIYNLITQYIKQAEKLSYPLKLDNNFAMNLTYQHFQSLITKASLVLPGASKQYLADYKQPKISLTLDQLFKKYGANLLIGIVLEEADLMPYLYRLYDLNDYLLLIKLKLEIKQAEINKQQLPEFLQKLADKANNPYNQKPYIWDADQQVISTGWLTEHVDTERDGERLGVYIQFSKENLSK